MNHTEFLEFFKYQKLKNFELNHQNISNSQNLLLMNFVLTIVNSYVEFVLNLYMYINVFEL